MENAAYYVFKSIVSQLSNIPVKTARECKYSHKLSDEDMEDILALSKTGVRQKDIAIKYSVSEAAISLMVNGIYKRRHKYKKD